MFKNSDNGNYTMFPGVTITDFGDKEHSDFTTSNGAIHATSDFDLALLGHEYGHYLQAQNYGTFTFNTIINMTNALNPSSIYSYLEG